MFSNIFKMFLYGNRWMKTFKNHFSGVPRCRMELLGGKPSALLKDCQNQQQVWLPSLHVRFSSVCGQEGDFLGEKLTVNFQHHRGLRRVSAGLGGLAAVDAGVLDDGVVDDQLGAGRLGVEHHALGRHDALALGVEPLQPHRLPDGWNTNKRTFTSTRKYCTFKIKYSFMESHSLSSQICLKAKIVIQQQ